MPKLRKARSQKGKKKRVQKRQVSRKVKDDTGISTGNEKRRVKLPKTAENGINFPKKAENGLSFPKKAENGLNFPKKAENGLNFPKKRLRMG